MKTRRLFSLLLPLLILGCGEDDPVVQPPDPLTPDEQVVANCRALRDAAEAYAGAHGGLYGEDGMQGLPRFVNPYSGEDEPSSGLGGSPGQITVEQYLDCDVNALGYRITGYGMDGVLITLENVSRVPQDIRYAHDVTWANVRVLVDAVQHFAATNNGVYPSDTGADTNLDGKTLVELLPNGRLLTNPVTSMQDNPVDGSSSGYGTIGYTPIDHVGDGTWSAFIIDASGCGYWVVLTVLPYSFNEEYVYQDALGLRAAVNDFRTASGHYPHNVDTETTPGGKTVLDLYFDQDYDFENPYTGEDYLPSLGIATNKGEVAYQPIETAGVVTSFTITGRGATKEILRLGPNQ